MYFPDLSQYEYDGASPKACILNIGWLSKEHPYTKGTLSESLLLRLKQLVQAPVNLYRGSHLCEFCPDPPVVLSPGGLKMINPPSDTRGNGEIRLKTADGTIFVAPVLIHHYIAAHGYLPPNQFIEAVQTGEPIAYFDDGC